MIWFETWYHRIISQWPKIPQVSFWHLPSFWWKAFEVKKNWLLTRHINNAKSFLLKICNILSYEYLQQICLKKKHPEIKQFKHSPFRYWYNNGGKDNELVNYLTTKNALAHYFRWIARESILKDDDYKPWEENL